jgi:hypothetical protein
MLNAEQTLYSKNEDKSIKHHMVLPAVYLQFGPNDATEEKTNSVKDEKSGKISPLKYKVPVFSTTVDGKQVDVVSSHDPNDLFSAAVDFYQGKFPDQNPILSLLSDASTGLNARLKIANSPVKTLDEADAIAKFVKTLRAMDPKMSEATATLLATNAAKSAKEAMAA